jgi:hypothetical protein
MSAEIFRSLGGKRTGKNAWLVRCPCPSHGKGKGDSNPSLSVGIGANGKPVFHCFAGCEFDDITAALDARGLSLDENRPFNGNRPRWKKPVIIEVENPNPEPNPDAVTLWNNSIEDSGRLIEYLARRGLLTLPRSIRWMPATSKMVAAVQRPLDGKVIAVQTTPIGPDATRTGDRKTCGALGAGAVRLAKAAPVMSMAEGVETGLAAMQMFGMPVWASLGSSRLHRVELPPEVQEVHIFGDNDRPGHVAADKAAEAHHKLGRKVILHFPADGLNDFNDVLVADADRDFVEGGAE